MRAAAPAKINLALVVGPLAAHGKHEVATVLQRVDLADRVAVTPADRLTVRGFPGDTLVRDALTALGAAAGVAPHWTVMVQREVADRFFAAPSTKAYGSVSVLVQLAAERTGFHPVSRTVFRPPPNVDSALVAFRRIELPERFLHVKDVVEAAFAHRRKTLPNSLALSGLASRELAAAALGAIGRSPETRAEALEPSEFLALADVL